MVYHVAQGQFEKVDIINQARECVGQAEFEVVKPRVAGKSNPPQRTNLRQTNFAAAGANVIRANGPNATAANSRARSQAPASMVARKAAVATKTGR